LTGSALFATTALSGEGGVTMGDWGIEDILAPEEEVCQRDVL